MDVRLRPDTLGLLQAEEMNVLGLSPDTRPCGYSISTRTDRLGKERTERKGHPRGWPFTIGDPLARSVTHFAQNMPSWVLTTRARRHPMASAPMPTRWESPTASIVASSSTASPTSSSSPVPAGCRMPCELTGPGWAAAMAWWRRRKAHGDGSRPFDAGCDGLQSGDCRKIRPSVRETA